MKARSVEKYLWEDSPFRSASYFCATTGSVSLDTVKKYIEDQRTEEHKRKYIKTGKYKKLVRFIPQPISSEGVFSHVVIIRMIMHVRT